MGEDLVCYSNQIESVGLRSLTYNKAYLSDITVTNISQSFTRKTAAKTSWHRYGTKLRHCHPMYCTPCSKNVHLLIFLITLSEILISFGTINPEKI